MLYLLHRMYPYDIGDVEISERAKWVSAAGL